MACTATGIVTQSCQGDHTRDERPEVASSITTRDRDGLASTTTNHPISGSPSIASANSGANDSPTNDTREETTSSPPKTGSVAAAPTAPAPGSRGTTTSSTVGRLPADLDIALLASGIGAPSFSALDLSALGLAIGDWTLAGYSETGDSSLPYGGEVFELIFINRATGAEISTNKVAEQWIDESDRIWREWPVPAEMGISGCLQATLMEHSETLRAEECGLPQREGFRSHVCAPSLSLPTTGNVILYATVCANSKRRIPSQFERTVDLRLFDSSNLEQPVEVERAVVPLKIAPKNSTDGFSWRYAELSGKALTAVIGRCLMLGFPNFEAEADSILPVEFSSCDRPEERKLIDGSSGNSLAIRFKLSTVETPLPWSRVDVRVAGRPGTEGLLFGSFFANADGFVDIEIPNLPVCFNIVHLSNYKASLSGCGDSHRGNSFYQQAPSP